MPSAPGAPDLRVHGQTGRAWALQSELEQRLPEFLPRLDTYEKDGALWARSSAYGDDDDRVIIRSPEQGGAPTYRAALDRVRSAAQQHGKACGLLVTSGAAAARLRAEGWTFTAIGSDSTLLAGALVAELHRSRSTRRSL